jgi:hypothetical protein
MQSLTPERGWFRVAFDPGPPPKRSDFVTAATYHLARGTWKTQKDAWRAEQRRQRQTERRAQTGPRHVQHRDNDVTVKVQSGYSVDQGVPTSDFIIAPHGSDEHVHHVLDEWGNPIYDDWNQNH